MTATGVAGTGTVAWLLAGALVVLGAVGGGTAQAEPIPAPVPPGIPSKVEQLPIIRVDRAGRRAMIATVSSGYCLGALYRPAIERVTLRWSRDGATRFRAVLTARVRTPVTPPTPARAGEGPVTVQVCDGIGFDLRAKVELPKPTTSIDFFDGSTSPPRPAGLPTYS